MTEKYNLLPCPFCGGRGHLERSARCFVGGLPSKAAFVRCVDCEARTSKVPIEKYGNTSHSTEAEKEAVEFWNR